MSAIDNTTNPPTAPQIEDCKSNKEVDEQEETILP